MVTLRDIAKEVGLNEATVSHVLRGSTRPYSPLTRNRVHEAAQRLGFVPNHAARRLARARSKRRATSFDQVGLISVMAPRTDMDWVCHAMMGGAEYELSKFHTSIFFVRVGDEVDWQKVERMTRAGGVDGWLVYGPVNDEIADRLRSSRLPFVILGDHRCTQPVHSVNVNNEETGRLAVKHLASQGHRRIGLLDGEVQFVYQEQTLAGFRAALRELGLADAERLIVHDAALWRESGAQRLSRWLTADPKPTAVFVPEVDMATVACSVLKKSQVEVPKEISVLTCDPVSVVAKSHGFSRIELPMSEVGRRGAQLLQSIALASTDPHSSSPEIKISPTLIEAASTCPPPGRNTEPT